jgi:hypothetical protein
MNNHFANGEITVHRTWMRYVLGTAALALALVCSSANAWQCDFLTGGGFIVRDTGAKANFGVGGGCKDGSPTWGHLEYIDHGMDLFGDVDWVVAARDRGEPGSDDEFIIRLTQFGVTVYTTEFDSDHTLGGSGPGGGNIQLHKPNPSTTGSFGGSCPALGGEG